jgi:hypothetical protein
MIAEEKEFLWTVKYVPLGHADAGVVAVPVLMVRKLDPVARRWDPWTEVPVLGDDQILDQSGVHPNQNVVQ